MVLLRVKMWIDDAVYFRNTQRTNGWFDVGIVAAVVAWCCWGLAGYLLGKPHASYQCLAYAMVALTAWNVAAWMHAGRVAGIQYMVFNLIYLVILLALSQETTEVFGIPRLVVAWALVLAVAADCFVHRSLNELVD
jgi:hypothetical protein